MQGVKHFFNSPPQLTFALQIHAVRMLFADLVMTIPEETDQ